MGFFCFICSVVLNKKIIFVTYLQIMKDLIVSFPENIEESLRIAASYTLKKPSEQLKNVVICGMGGSGIGGKR